MSSTLHRWLEPVRMVIKRKGPMLDVTQLGFTIPITWEFWLNHVLGGNDLRPAESAEPFHWQELGWIFRQGQCIAIEGKGSEVRARTMVA
jgi:hypothetical protein